MAVKMHKISTPLRYNFAQFIGFYTAHMVWSLDTDDNVPPMLAVQKANQAWIERFEGESYKQVANKAIEKFESLSLDKGDYIFIAYDGFLIDGEKREESLFISAFENQDLARTACLLTIPYRSARSPDGLAIKRATIFLSNHLSGLDKELFLKGGQEGVYFHTKGFEFWKKHLANQSDPIKIVETVNQDKLYGTWISDPTDMASTLRFEKVKLYFIEGKRLTYQVFLGNHQKLYFLTYRIENNILITDQPSDPQEKMTRFRITKEGKLELEYLEGFISRYVRTRFPEHLLMYR